MLKISDPAVMSLMFDTSKIESGMRPQQAQNALAVWDYRGNRHVPSKKFILSHCVENGIRLKRGESRMKESNCASPLLMGMTTNIDVCGSYPVMVKKGSAHLKFPNLEAARSSVDLAVWDYSLLHSGMTLYEMVQILTYVDRNGQERVPEHKTLRTYCYEHSVKILEDDINTAKYLAGIRRVHGIDTDAEIKAEFLNYGLEYVRDDKGDVKLFKICPAKKDYIPSKLLYVPIEADEKNKAIERNLQDQLDEQRKNLAEQRTAWEIQKATEEQDLTEQVDRLVATRDQFLEWKKKQARRCWAAYTREKKSHKQTIDSLMVTRLELQKKDVALEAEKCKVKEISFLQKELAGLKDKCQTAESQVVDIAGYRQVAEELQKSLQNSHQELEMMTQKLLSANLYIGELQSMILDPESSTSTVKPVRSKKRTTVKSMTDADLLLVAQKLEQEELRLEPVHDVQPAQEIKPEEVVSPVPESVPVVEQSKEIVEVVSVPVVSPPIPEISKMPVLEEPRESVWSGLGRRVRGWFNN